MRDWLQTQLFGPYFGSFSAHSYSYELSNDPKSVLKLLDFRFSLYSPTASWRASVAWCLAENSAIRLSPTANRLL